MTIAVFNIAVEESRAKAEAILPEFEQTYERLIRRAGREAAQAFRKQTATAEPVTAAGWQPPPEGNLLNFASLAGIATRALQNLHRKVARETTGAPLTRIGISWKITHPLTAAMLEAAAQRTGTMLGQAVQPVLRDVLAQAYADGLSVNDAADLIRERIADAAPASARMLARTDLNGLANGGSVAAARLAGVPYKQWLTAEDDRVREMHVEADGQIVPADQPFQVCGELLDYPGDPAGSDECVCNCRCSVAYLDSAEAVASALPRGGDMTFGATYGGGNGGAGWQPIGTASGGGGASLVFVEGTTAAVMAPPEVRWTSDIAFEGTATDDGRYILPGALDWRELPLTLMAMTETGPGGHEGAFVAGRIDKITRARSRNMAGDPLEKGVTAIRATGVFDMGGDMGTEVARLVDDETVRGVSIDMAVSETALRDPETGRLIPPGDETEDDLMRLFAGELQFAVSKGTIMAATVCPTPAFANARIAVTASGEKVLRLTMPFTLVREVVTASAAGLAPTQPPHGWFFTPEAKTLTPLTVTDDGHVFGHIAPWNACHTGYPGQCKPPPSSPSGYAFFNAGEIRCDDGQRVQVGQITFDTGHAETTIGMTAKAAKRHYDDTGVCAADVRAVDGALGVWVSGALRPGISEKEARAFMGAKPSGDWRQMRPGGPLELIAIHAVNAPGFPVPRVESRLVASAENPDGEVVAMIASVVLREDETFDRRLRVLAARAESGIEGLAELAGV